MTDDLHWLVERRPASLAALRRRRGVKSYVSTVDSAPDATYWLVVPLAAGEEPQCLTDLQGWRITTVRRLPTSGIFCLYRPRWAANAPQSITITLYTLTRPAHHEPIVEKP
jgi:hypothetical protein